MSCRTDSHVSHASKKSLRDPNSLSCGMQAAGCGLISCRSDHAARCIEYTSTLSVQTLRTTFLFPLLRLFQLLKIRDGQRARRMLRSFCTMRIAFPYSSRSIHAAGFIASMTSTSVSRPAPSATVLRLESSAATAAACMQVPRTDHFVYLTPQRRVPELHLLHRQVDNRPIFVGRCSVSPLLLCWLEIIILVHLVNGQCRMKRLKETMEAYNRVRKSLRNPW